MTQPTTFVSHINGTKFNVTNPQTASLLSKNEKKEILYQEQPKAKRGGGKNDNEQVIR